MTSTTSGCCQRAHDRSPQRLDHGDWGPDCGVRDGP